MKISPPKSSSEASGKSEALECVEWVRRVNSRWLVHDGLDESARAYLEHLEATDPARLVRSCRIARSMMERNSGCAIEDPKPRFYGGLFSLATPEEGRCYLGGRLFLEALWSGDNPPPGHGLSEATLRKLETLREEIAQVKMRTQS